MSKDDIVEEKIRHLEGWVVRLTHHKTSINNTLEIQKDGERGVPVTIFSGNAVALEKIYELLEVCQLR